MVIVALLIWFLCIPAGKKDGKIILFGGQSGSFMKQQWKKCFYLFSNKKLDLFRPKGWFFSLDRHYLECIPYKWKKWTPEILRMQIELHFEPNLKNELSKLKSSNHDLTSNLLLNPVSKNFILNHFCQEIYSSSLNPPLSESPFQTYRQLLVQSYRSTI